MKYPMPAVAIIILYHAAGYAWPDGDHRVPDRLDATFVISDFSMMTPRITPAKTELLETPQFTISPNYPNPF